MVSGQNWRFERKPPRGTIGREMSDLLLQTLLGNISHWLEDRPYSVMPGRSKLGKYHLSPTPETGGDPQAEWREAIADKANRLRGAE